jgi:gluconate 2-dehydrogenase gamma chain
MNQPTRRIFLKSTGAAALLPAATAAQAVRPAPATAAPAPQASVAAERFSFFNVAEREFIEAAVERLIPPDEVGPSAIEAGVPSYLDKQLGGAWGAGERLYRSGPWQKGTPTQGYQLPFTPAELFRTAIRAIGADLQKRHGKTFAALSGPAKDAYLTDLQVGQVDLDGLPSNVFFESLLGMTVEGYFSDPVYGGNVGMAAWRMIGFPGAYGAYYDLVGEPVAFRGEPRSLAQSGSGNVHVDPNIPAQPHRGHP